MDESQPNIGDASPNPQPEAAEPACAAAADPRDASDAGREDLDAERLMEAWPVLSPATRRDIVATVRPLLPYLDATPPADRPEATDLAEIVSVWPDLPAAIRAESLARVNFDLAARWKLAVHEGGHAVAALALRGDGVADAGPIRAAIGAAIGKHLGGRTGPQTPGLTKGSVSFQVLLAGGLAAEAMMDEIGPRPDLDGRTSTAEGAVDTGHDAGRARAEAEAWVDDSPPVATDAQRLVEVCTAGQEDRPWAWARRHAEIVSAARAVLARNLAALRAAARRLYLSGGFSISTLGELTEPDRAGGRAAAPSDESITERTHDDGFTGQDS